ncbi:MAG TPA: rod shape-determining protein MreC [Casimicrobiaceae bacterium]|nr:rod shape-determining protein MreC [Casimicrobiaceae bacterium]
MSYLPVDPPAFFHRGPSPATRLVVVTLCSIALLFLDTRYRYLEQMRQAVAVVLYPLQRAAQLPGEAFAGVADYFVSKKALAEENESLKRRLAEQGSAAQALESRQQENVRLKALLQMKSEFRGDATAVRVLYTGRDPFAQKLFIDKGREAGLIAGSAVVDADGVIGQVTRLYPFMGEVTLVTDKDHVIPVKLERNGVRAVMAGNGAGRAPELRFMPPSADVRVGDMLVTSGLDGTYPTGLAVARVATLERETGQIFARITLAPVAGVNRSDQLLVLAQSAELPPRPDEAVATEAAKKGGKARLRRSGGG